MDSKTDSKQHTPGPWSFDENTAKVWDAEDMPVCIPTLNQGIEGRDANARLISTAPELLSVLKQMARRFKPITGGDEYFLQCAQDLIARAEGRQ